MVTVLRLCEKRRRDHRIEQASETMPAVTGFSAREEEAQRCHVGVAEHVDFGCQATTTGF